MKLSILYVLDQREAFSPKSFNQKKGRSPINLEGQWEITQHVFFLFRHVRSGVILMGGISCRFIPVFLLTRFAIDNLKGYLGRLFGLKIRKLVAYFQL